MILTDGRSNTGHVSGPARQLKNSGVVIFSVGIGQSVSQQELRVMASDPADQHVIMLGNFTELESLSEKMSSQTCNGKCNGWWKTGSEGNDCSVHDEGRDNGASDDGARDDGASDDGASDDGASDDGASDDGASDDGASDDGASDDGASDDGASDDGASDCGDLSNEGHSNNDGDYTL